VPFLFRVGEIHPDFFMSDDSPAYFNAWAETFGAGKTRKLLCIWHVKRNWSKKIGRCSENKELLSMLNMLANQQDKQAFFSHSDKIKHYLSQKLQRNDLVSYFGK